MRPFCNTDRGLSLYNKGRYTNTAQLYMTEHGGVVGCVVGGERSSVGAGYSTLLSLLHQRGLYAGSKSLSTELMVWRCRGGSYSSSLAGVATI